MYKSSELEVDKPFAAIFATGLKSNGPALSNKFTPTALVMFMDDALLELAPPVNGACVIANVVFAFDEIGEN